MKPMPYYNKQGKIVSYTLRYFKGTNKAGKKEVISKTWKVPDGLSKTKIEKELKRVDYEFQNACQKRFVNGTDMLFSVLLDKVYFELYAVNNLKKRTIYDYKQLANLRVIYAFGHLPASEINEEMLSEFFADLKKPGAKITQGGKGEPLSDKSVENYYIVLRSVFRVLQEWGYISHNPMLNIRIKKSRRSRVKSLTPAQAQAIVASLEKAPLKYRIYITLTILSGCRSGEVDVLRWNNFDFEKCIVKIDEAVQYTPEDGVYVAELKTEKSKRVLRLSRKFFDLLLLYKAEQDKIKQQLGPDWNPNEYLFITNEGSVMHPHTAYNWFTRWLKRNNLPHCSIHQLRHTNATLCILNGVPETVVSNRLGHSSTSTTTNIYTDYIQEADQMASDTVDHIIFGDI